MVAGSNRDGALVRLEMIECASTQLSSGRAETCTVRDARYRLSASEELLRLCPEIEDVNFRVLETADGTRRFLPTREDGFDGWVDITFPLGLALLARARGFDGAMVDEYRIAKSAYDWSQRTQEHLRLKFRTVNDLLVRRGDRRLVERDHLLPESENNDRPMTFRRLREVGRRAAEEDGYVQLSPEVIMRHGLHQAGAMNPLSVASREISSLLRLAMFDLSQLPSHVSDDHRRIVESKFAALVNGRSADSPCRFRDWLCGGKSNFLGSLARRKDSEGETVGREVAKRALLDFGWEATFRVAECLEAAAKALVESLPRPLSADERSSLEGTYYRQGYFGGLSLALLAVRGRMLQPALEAIWSRPDDLRQILAMHRQLQHYGDVAPLQREIERVKKQKRSPIVCLDGLDETAIRSLERTTAIDDILAVVMQRRKSRRCRTCGNSLEARWTSGDFREGAALRFELCCDDHGRCGDILVEWSELEAAARSWQGQ